MPCSCFICGVSTTLFSKASRKFFVLFFFFTKDRGLKITEENLVPTEIRLDTVLVFFKML